MSCQTFETSTETFRRDLMTSPTNVLLKPLPYAEAVPRQFTPLSSTISIMNGADLAAFVGGRVESLGLVSIGEGRAAMRDWRNHYGGAAKLKFSSTVVSPAALEAGAVCSRDHVNVRFVQQGRTRRVGTAA
jgi:hypothetical protein